MLAAVDRNHLAGDARRAGEEQDGVGDFRRRRAALQQDGCALLGEILIALAGIGERRTRSDGVHADAGGERLGHGARGREEGRLRQRVGEELGRELQDPLIDDVDDRAGEFVRQEPCEVAGTGRRVRAGSPQNVGPTAPHRRSRRRRLKLGGVVDEEGHRSEGLAGALHQSGHGGRVREVGLEHGGPPSPRLDLSREVLPGCERAVA